MKVNVKVGFENKLLGMVIRDGVRDLSSFFVESYGVESRQLLFITSDVRVGDEDFQCVVSCLNDAKNAIGVSGIINHH